MIPICVGVKSCDWRKDGNVKWDPLDIPGEVRTVENSLESCRQRCVNTAGCYGMSFWPDGGCHLAGEDATLVANNDNVQSYGCSTSSIRYFAYLYITLLVKSTFNLPLFVEGEKHCTLYL